MKPEAARALVDLRVAAARIRRLGLDGDPRVVEALARAERELLEAARSRKPVS